MSLTTTRPLGLACTKELVRVLKHERYVMKRRVAIAPLREDRAGSGESKRPPTCTCNIMVCENTHLLKIVSLDAM